jgi:hypothetical protein
MVASVPNREKTDRGRRRPHQRAIAGSASRPREVLGRGYVPRPAGAEHRARLVADVRRPSLGPTHEPVEQVGLVQPVALDQ